MGTMRKLLIAVISDEHRDALKELLSGRYEVTDCVDGDTAIKLLHDWKPNVMVLDLALPQSDGITVLQNAGCDLPEIVLALSALPVDYVQLALVELGVDYILMKPCSVNAIVSHIERMERFRESAETTPGILDRAGTHLRRLGVGAHLDGYKQLRVGIPLYAQNPEQHIFKELYADVAIICGNDNVGQVEHSVRVAIKRAWEVRDESVWADYFGTTPDGRVRCPSNKVFIAKLAEKLA